MTRIERLLRDNPGLPVLFTSDPEAGDSFEFGTHEELQTELEALQEAGKDAELSTAHDFAARLDFTVYEDNEPTVRR